MTPGHPAYPPRLGPTGPALYARGAVGLLAHRLVAVFASIKTPGSAILRALDWARLLDAGDSVVIGGFHSPLEQECLSLLLKRAVPVIAFPAREIARYRLPTEWQVAIDAERLLAVSPFEDQRRITAMTSSTRNELVASLADELIILHASPGGAIARLAQTWTERGKPVRSLTDGTFVTS